MKLILVRHGETDYNRKGITQGQSESKLTRKGIEQAKKLAKQLAKEKIDIIYVSDLKRTKDTAKHIVKYHKKIPIIYESLIRERNMGEDECHPSQESHKKMKALGKDRLKYRPKGGETISDLRKRAKKFFKKIYPAEKEKTILVVTHGGIIMRLLMWLFKAKEQDHNKYHPANASITIIKIKDDDNYKIIKMNSMEHL